MNDFLEEMERIGYRPINEMDAQPLMSDPHIQKIYSEMKKRFPYMSTIEFREALRDVTGIV
jgi:hypothetical protein